MVIMKRFCIAVTLYEVLAQQLYLYSQVDIPTFPFLIEKAIDRINERDKRRVQWPLSKFPKSLFHFRTILRGQVDRFCS